MVSSISNLGISLHLNFFELSLVPDRERIFESLVFNVLNVSFALYQCHREDVDNVFGFIILFSFFLNRTSTSEFKKLVEVVVFDGEICKIAKG